jgi:hypothetical protein
MSAISVNRHNLSMIDRAAIRIGETLVVWGRHRAERAREDRGTASYRSDYAERVRTASALGQQRLLP